MNILRKYIKEILLKENEYNWSTASKKTMLLDKPGMEDSDKDNQEEYLKSMGLMESVLKPQEILIPGPPTETQRVSELPLIQNQYRNRRAPEQLQAALDESSSELFNAIVKSAGHPCAMGLIKDLRAGTIDTIKNHKDHFGSERPAELASRIGYPFEVDYLESAQTPSYPSGHAAQAYYTAFMLGDLYPDLSESFIDLAEVISDSRVDRGVHFPSDISAGKQLAEVLYEMTKRHM